MSVASKIDLTDLNFIKEHILSHYDLEINHIEIIKIKKSDKERAIYKVTTPHFDYCLKKVYYSVYDLEFVLYLMEYLKNKHMNVPEIIRTRKQEPYVCHDHVLFFLMTWIDGVRCNYDYMPHLELITQNLARFHQHGSDFNYLPKAKNRYNYCNWYHDFHNKAGKLLKFRDSIYSDYQFSLVHEPLFAVLQLEFPAIIKSLSLLSAIDFDRILKKAVVENRYCHLDYVNKNLYIDNDKVYMIDFDRAKLDIPLHDLSSLLRRIMYRSNTNWNFSVAKYIIDTYGEINPLTLDEKKALLAFLIFPEKLYKEARRFMRNDGDETYFIERFHKLKNRSARKEQFIQEFENHYL